MRIGDARSSRNRACDERAVSGERRSRRLGPCDHPQPEDVRATRPPGYGRLDRDQARGSCETALLTRAPPSRALRARWPPGQPVHVGRTWSGNRARRSVSEVLITNAGPPSPRGAERSRAPGGTRPKVPRCSAGGGFPKSPERIAKVLLRKDARERGHAACKDEEDASMSRESLARHPSAGLARLNKS